MLPAKENFQYDVTTENDAIQALTAVVGPDLAQVLWRVSAQSLSVEQPVTAPSDLRRVAEHITDLGDLARIAGRSLMLRIITYEALSRVTT
jgi:hypothetical protein